MPGKKKGKQGRKPDSGKARRQRPPKAKAKKLGIGQELGGMIGRALGGAAQQLFKHVTGVGAYKVNSNTLMEGTDPPYFSKIGKGTRVVHREYLQDISGSTGFQVQSFALNPGLGVSFPWVASFASQFEEYAIRGCIFEFKSTSAVALNSTNTALGTVILATEYNAAKAAFISKLQMENYEFTTSGPPSEDIYHPIECARSVNPVSELYVRTGGVPSGQDPRLYDLGLFQLATVGMQAAAVIGELWVTYDIEFFKPILQPNGGQSLVDHWTLNSNIVATTSPFGTQQTSRVNALGGTLSNNNTYSLPSDVKVGDTFITMYRVAGTSAAWTLPTCTLSAGLTSVSFTSDSQANWNFGATSQVFLHAVTFKVSSAHLAGSVETLIYSGGSFPTSPTGGDFMLIYLGQNLS